MPRLVVLQLSLVCVRASIPTSTRMDKQMRKQISISRESCIRGVRYFDSKIRTDVYGKAYFNPAIQSRMRLCYDAVNTPFWEIKKEKKGGKP